MNTEKIFSTSKTCITQCDDSELFLLTYEKEKITFKLCDLYMLRKKIMEINMINLFDTHTPDIEIIHLRHCDRLLILGINEILEFRTLLDGTFNVLALNSVVQRILKRRCIFNF